MLNKKNIDLSEVRKLILYPVIAGVLIMLIAAAAAWFFTVGDNKQQIELLKTSKVDTEKFNQFLKMYAEFAVLTEERDKIQNSRLDVLEERQREIEMERLVVIEKNIAIIQEHMKQLLKEYGFYTRDGQKEIKINPLLLIEET